MLHSKQFQDIESALRFANDFNNKLIPVSFVDVTPGPSILLVYEPIEVPKPGTHEQDLLREAVSLIDDLAYDGLDASANVIGRLFDLQAKIKRCLN